MTHLYVIRHAQPAGYTPALIGLSPPNSGLSPLGVRQAERLRDRLLATKEIQADRLISSPLRRAQETAEIIAPALGLPVLLDDGIQELNLGECEGLTADQASERYGDTDWERNPFRRLAPHADSWAEFAWRACEALHRLTRDYEGQTLVMVCHGDHWDDVSLLPTLAPLARAPAGCARTLDGNRHHLLAEGISRLGADEV